MSIDIDQTESLEILILDLLEWLEPGPRPYLDVMAAWRTSCPRLPVWEEAVDRGFVIRFQSRDSGPCVMLTPAARTHLRSSRPAK